MFRQTSCCSFTKISTRIPDSNCLHKNDASQKVPNVSVSFRGVATHGRTFYWRPLAETTDKTRVFYHISPTNSQYSWIITRGKCKPECEKVYRGCFLVPHSATSVTLQNEKLCFRKWTVQRWTWVKSILGFGWVGSGWMRSTVAL